MAIPGVIVNERIATTRSTPPTDTAVAFVAAPASQGPLAPQRVLSIDQATDLYGPRDPVGMLYDWLDVFFKEGGTVAWVSRVAGSGATAAQTNVLDAANAVSLSAAANGPGTWGQLVTFEVVAGAVAGTYAIKVTVNGALKERSPDLSTRDDAIFWAQLSSKYLVLTAGASTNAPKVQGPTALSGGSNGSAIADGDFQPALDRFSKKYGPGQVAAPGRTSATVQNALLAHAAANNRHALIDMPDTATASVLTTAAGALAGANARYGSAYAPWERTTGIAPGTFRAVPPSAMVAGMMARNDPVNGAGQPVAGQNAVSNTAALMSQEYSDPDLSSLNDAGVNVIRELFGQIRIQGMRTLANPTSQQPYLQNNQVRVLMAIIAELRAESESFTFSKLDGLGHTFSRYQAALTSVCSKWWRLDELYGNTLPDAAVVDVGPAVNTPESLNAGQLKARVSLRVTPGAEFVIIELVKVPITEAIAA